MTSEYVAGTTFNFKLANFVFNVVKHVTCSVTAIDGMGDVSGEFLFVMHGLLHRF